LFYKKNKTIWAPIPNTTQLVAGRPDDLKILLAVVIS
jgi:hypothetical protein